MGTACSRSRSNSTGSSYELEEGRRKAYSEYSRRKSFAQKQKSGFITEDERRLKDLPEGLSYSSWLLCKPEMAEVADVHMVTFSEEMADQALAHLPQYVADSDDHDRAAFSDGSNELLPEMKVRRFLQNIHSNRHQAGHMAELWTSLDTIAGQMVEGIAEKDLGNRQTFFHVASIFGWTGLVKQLMDRGDVKLRNAMMYKDSRGFTPLHYIAWYGRFEILQTLMRRSIVLNLSDCLKEKTIRNRTAFHLASRNGHARTLKLLVSLAFASNSCKVIELLTEKDCLGMTPLHLSVLHGRQQVTHLLLKNGAFADAKDSYQRTPLHLAAIRGHTAVGENILESQGKHIVDLRAKDGKTALLYACMRDKEDFVTMMLEHNASLRPSNSESFKEPSALALAVRLRCGQAVRAILQSDRWEEAFAAAGEERERLPGRGMREVEVVKDITTVLAEQPEIFELLLDQFTIDDDAHNVQFVRDSPDMQPSKPLRRHYYFRYLYHHFSHNFDRTAECPPLCNIHPECKQTRQLINHEDCVAKESSRCIVQTILDNPNIKHLLLKPIVVQWMKKKWTHFLRRWTILNLFIYSIFLVFFTIMVVTVEPFQRCPDFIDVKNLGKYKRGTLGNVSAGFVVIMALISLLKECIEIKNRGLRYLGDVSNYLEWPLYFLSIAFALVGRDHPSKYDWNVAMVAITLAWSNLLLFLIRFTFFGIYTVMFLKILQTVLQVLVVFVLFILGFGFAFYILLSEMENFETVPRALATTLTFATNGLDLTEFFTLSARQAFVPGTNSSCNDIHHAQIVPVGADSAQQLDLLYPTLSWIFLVAFIFIGPIILTNLLTGLAVDDISEIRKKASQDIAERQATLILEGERTMVSFRRFKLFRKILPNFYGVDVVHEDMHGNGGTDSGKPFSWKDIPLVRTILDIFAFDLDAEKTVCLQPSFYESRLDNVEISNKQIVKTLIHIHKRLDMLSSTHGDLTKTVGELGVQHMDAAPFEDSSETLRCRVVAEESATKQVFPKGAAGSVETDQTSLCKIKNQLDQQQASLESIDDRLRRQEDNMEAIKRMLSQLVSHRHAAPYPKGISTDVLSHESAPENIGPISNV